MTRRGQAIAIVAAVALACAGGLMWAFHAPVRLHLIGTAITIVLFVAYDEVRGRRPKGRG